MQLDPSWTPQEDAATLLSERAWLAGAMLSGFGYGIVVVLCILCARTLWGAIRSDNALQRYILMIYVACTFIFATLFAAGTAKMNEYSFVDYRHFPGGPAAFELFLFSIPIDLMATISTALASWLADGLLCWRCMVIFSNTTPSRWLTRGLPLFAYIAEIVMGILWMIQISAPSSSIWNSKTINFTPPYFWLGFGINLFESVAIACRLLLFRWNISQAFESGGYGSLYVSLAAVFIESSLLYSAILLLFLIPFTMGHPIQSVFLELFGEAQMIPPLLIVYRVASGVAWSDGTSADVLSSLRAQPGIVKLETAPRHELNDLRPDANTSKFSMKLGHPGL